VFTSVRNNESKSPVLLNARLHIGRYFEQGPAGGEVTEALG
jgi:hypothetical protein